MYKIRVMPKTIRRIRPGCSGGKLLLDGASVEFSREDNWFIRTNVLHTISEDVSESSSIVVSDRNPEGDPEC